MRPEPLPFSAARVIKASQVLSWPAKALWIEVFALDNTAEGCYAGAQALADRLGTTSRTIERARAELARAGLLATARRPRRGQRGALTDSWWPQLPAGLELPSANPAPAELLALAGQLDRLIDAGGGGATVASGSPTSDSRRGRARADADARAPASRPINPPDVAGWSPADQPDIRGISDPINPTLMVDQPDTYGRSTRHPWCAEEASSKRTRAGRLEGGWREVEANHGKAVSSSSELSSLLVGEAGEFAHAHEQPTATAPADAPPGVPAVVTAIGAPAPRPSWREEYFRFAEQADERRARRRPARRAAVTSGRARDAPGPVRIGALLEPLIADQRPRVRLDN